MFGTIGGTELILIFAIALIVFGPRKLPEIGKSLGKMLSEFRRASNDLKRTLEEEVEAEKLREVVPSLTEEAAALKAEVEADKAQLAQNIREFQQPVPDATAPPDAVPSLREDEPRSESATPEATPPASSQQTQAGENQ